MLTESDIAISVQSNQGKAEYARAQQQASQIRTLAEAEADKIRIVAEGEAQKIKALADADAEKATSRYCSSYGNSGTGSCLRRTSIPAYSAGYATFCGSC